MRTVFMHNSITNYEIIKKKNKILINRNSQSGFNQRFHWRWNEGEFSAKHEIYF